MDYFSSEDAPLLGDFVRRSISDPHRFSHIHHEPPQFEVADFPDTPLLQDYSDDEFSDFIESPASEVPPNHKVVEEDSSTAKLADLPTLEYIQHVAIIIVVQLLIPIPFMIPMGFNFAKRSLKVFLPGFALGTLAHTLILLFSKAPETTYYDHFHHTPVDPSIFIPALFEQIKLGIIGGFLTGAVMSHVLNFAILTHTIGRLARGLDPEPTAMRRAMDSSKTFQGLRNLILDLLAGMAMLPAGCSARRSFCQSLINAGLLAGPKHSIMIGILGTAAIRLYQWHFRTPTARSFPTDPVQLAAKCK